MAGNVKTGVVRNIYFCWDGGFYLNYINLHVFIIIIEMSTKKSSSSLKYFSEEGSGFKIQPKTVLIMSLIYIGLVVLLHIYAKLGTSKPAQVETPAPEPATNSAEQPEQAEAEAQSATGEEI